MDMSEHVAPKSDQLDAEDLRSGPRDVTVKAVTRGPSEEQPINFHLEETDRPWRPTKTVRRLIMGVWGKETDVYPTRRLRLYRDPDVTFGGMAVGGIRVSHMSHLPTGDQPFRAIVMTGRARSSEFTIHPLPDVAPQGGATSEKPEPLTDKTRAHVFALLGELGVDDVEEQKARMSRVLRRKITSRTELTESDGQRLIAAMQKALSKAPQGQGSPDVAASVEGSDVAASAAPPAPEVNDNEPDPNFPPTEEQ